MEIKAILSLTLKILLVIEKIFLCISKYSNISRNLKAIKDAAGRGVRIFSSTKNQVQSRYEMKSMVIIWWYKGRTCPSRGVTDMDMRNEGWQHGYMVRDEIKDLIFISNMPSIYSLDQVQSVRRSFINLHNAKCKLQCHYNRSLIV